jgi:hypothetical protein
VDLRHRVRQVRRWSQQPTRPTSQRSSHFHLSAPQSIDDILHRFAEHLSKALREVRRLMDTATEPADDLTG